MACKRDWQDTIEHLNNKSFRAIAPDLKGHGSKSYKIELHTFSHYSENLKALFDRIKISFFEAGIAISLGGAILQLLAVDHPNLYGKLILLNSVRAEGNVLPSAPDENGNSHSVNT